jgi:hypothetical protein
MSQTERRRAEYSAGAPDDAWPFGSVGTERRHP